LLISIDLSTYRPIDYRLTTNDRNSYNSRVNTPVPPKPAADNERRNNDRRGNEHPDNQHQHRHSIYAAEATGLLVMAVLLLVLTIIRYWRYIPWSAR
jgi:hypothetical protein